MLDPDIIEQLLDSPQVREEMAQQPCPFEPIPEKAAIERLIEARSFVQHYASLMAVHLRTNPVETHQSYMGEDPINQGLAEMTDLMKAILTGAIMQRRIADTKFANTLEGLQFLKANVDACILQAHEEVVGALESSIGRTIESVRTAAEEASRLRAMAMATPAAEA